jgi:hypothetical protein
MVRLHVMCRTEQCARFLGHGGQCCLPKWKVLYLDSLQPTGCALVYTSPNGASHIELPGSPPGGEWSIGGSEVSSSG